MYAHIELKTWSPVPTPPKPPPLWLVTDGDVTVGPVPTKLLVRGVLEGRVWDGFYVRDTRNQNWRAVHTIREVRALNEQIYRRTVPLAPPQLDTAKSLEVLLSLTDEPREILTLGLELAARRVTADFGLVHCFDDPHKAPITKFEHGQGPTTRIGERLSWSEPLPKIARARCIAMGDPRSITELRLAATRLAGDADRVRGVAMVPIACARGVVGMLELGRVDHPFRASDGVILREVMSRIVNRLERA